MTTPLTHGSPAPRKPTPLLRIWDRERHDDAPHPDVEASDQIVDAVLDLDRHPDLYLRWPWRALDGLCDGMAPGEVHYVCAFSGGGKTTFLASAVNRWIDAKKRVYVLPLETEPKKFRTYLACQRLGIHPGDAFSGELRKRNDPALPVLVTELRSQIKPPDSDHLRVKGVPAINVARLAEACEEAAEWQADVIIVDHIDHIAGGDGTNLYAESVAVNKAVLDFARRYGLTLVLASQLNNDAVRGPDRLACYEPPRESHVKMGAHKRENSSSMIGLFRPKRSATADEGPKAFAAKLKAARAGEIEPREVLEQHTMGVVLMKSRNYGLRNWQKVTLRVENGRVVDNALDRESTRPFGERP